VDRATQIVSKSQREADKWKIFNQERDPKVNYVAIMFVSIFGDSEFFKSELSSF
jgi:hypothetical protein